MKRLMIYLFALTLMYNCSEKEILCNECYLVLEYEALSYVGIDKREYRYLVLDKCDNQRKEFFVLLNRDITAPPPQTEVCDRNFFY